MSLPSAPLERRATAAAEPLHSRWAPRAQRRPTPAGRRRGASPSRPTPTPASRRGFKRTSGASRRPRRISDAPLPPPPAPGPGRPPPVGPATHLFIRDHAPLPACGLGVGAQDA